MKTTPYYTLPLYEDNDPQDLRDGYNRAMRLLDQKLHQLDVKLQDAINMDAKRHDDTKDNGCDE